MKTRHYPLTMTGYASPTRVRRWAGIALMIALAGWCISGWQKTTALDAQIAALQEQREELHFLLERQQRAQPQSAVIDSAEMIKIRQRLNAPWQPLLAALDKAALPSVSLMAVSPDADSQKVQLTVVALSLEQALQYIQKLEATATLSNVYLVSQQPIAAALPNPMLVKTELAGKTQFVLKADWRHP